MVVAEDRYQAQDAVEAIDVDYDVLPAVIDLKKAASDEVKIHDELDSNVLHTWTYHGYWAALGLEDQTPQVDAAMERDDAVVVSLEMINQRLIPVAIEPRSVLAEYNPGYGCFTVHSSTQVPHALGRRDCEDLRDEVHRGAGDRSRGRRRIRQQAQRLQRRDPGRLCRQGPGTPGEVDRDPPRGGRIDHPRTGLDRDRDPGRDQGRRSSSVTSSTPSPTWAPTPRTSRSPSPCSGSGSHPVSTRCPSPGRWPVWSPTP